jgi:glycosyltransferase involved in cell wall biosynthesis
MRRRVSQEPRRSRTLSIVVPAYNESANVQATVATIMQAAATLEDVEILLVDDGSVDDTGRIADELANRVGPVTVIHHGVNRGFAAAYKTGLEHARMDYVTFLPGDNEVALESVANIFAAVGKADLVIPYHATPWKRAWYRRILTWVCVTEINLLFGWRQHYYQGPTVYPTRLARAIPTSTPKFFFITEMLVHALIGGYSWVEVGLTHQERSYGRSKAVAWSNIVDAERTILRLWWNVRIRGQRLAPTRYRDRIEPAITGLQL